MGVRVMGVRVMGVRVMGVRVVGVRVMGRTTDSFLSPHHRERSELSP
jgi:hypothetical protein